ncbi:MAG TPA: hypothetical protein VFB41_10850 [Solirubrobacteraceae bacterium]|nr:hypothetical protein [Solirubrobacteraceae bacterium]
MPQIGTPPSTGLFDTSRSLHGTEAVAFSASDAGGGVSSASLVVDGVERDRRVLDANNGGCQRPYSLSVPCKPNVSASYGFDTTALADGRHDVTLQVRDATEVNQATYGPISITVDNTPALPDVAVDGIGGGGGANGGGGISQALASLPHTNGTTADPLARLSGTGGTRTLRFGSATILRGRLNGRDGRPIGHARLDVLAKVRKPGAKRVQIGHPTTAADGSYSFRLAAGPSRDVTIGYRAHTGDRAYTATLRTVVLVRAGVRLRRSATRLRNGTTLTLTADVLGTQVKARAATIAFQVKVGSRWRTFAASSIDAHRRATIRHRFRYTKAATTYRFRARTIRTASFPYVTGVSPATSVVVVP